MQKFVVREASMQPVLRPGDRVLAWNRTPSLGDIVVFHASDDSERWFIKRVVAVSGAMVRIGEITMTVRSRGGHSAVWLLPHREHARTWDLVDNEVFVLSEDLGATRADSRVYGPLPTVGMFTVFFRYAPLRRLRWRP